MKHLKLNMLFLFSLLIIISSPLLPQQNWTHRVRIAGHPLSTNNSDSIIKSASESRVYGIEVDNDITGRYESFINPEEKLEAIREVTGKAHAVNNKTFVYIAGLECITSDADKKEHTFFKDHPDWVQRDINGKPAIFGGNDAFWIDEGDEDVWISPYAAEWRKIYMQRVREIAETGIDGIYVDIPYWMTHFEGWENTWASFDDYTAAAFKKETGLNAKEDIQLGNFDDPGFLKWINFRMRTLTDFMEEIDRNIKEVNPQCMTIAEIYPGIGEEAVRVGADVYQMYEVVDVIAHEYSEGEYYASDRAPLDWYNYIIGMHTFRAFAGDKASWMLCYSWYNNEKVKPADAIKSLFASQLFSGTNMWDVNGYVMSGTNDIETRKTVYEWVSRHEDIFYSKRTPLDPVSVYFSDITRNFFSKDYLESYRGFLNLLIHSQINFQIVTPRTVGKLSPDLLILPDVKCLSEDEINAFKKLSDKGTKFIVTGETGKYDVNKQVREADVFEGIFKSPKESQNKNYVYLQNCPGKNYNQIINTDLNKYFKENRVSGKIDQAGKEFQSLLKDSASYLPEIKINGPIDLIASASISGENIYIYLTNVKGLCESCNSGKRSIKEIKIAYDDSLGNDEASVLPFLGNEIKINAVHSGKEFTLTIPEIERGAVVTLKRIKKN